MKKMIGLLAVLFALNLQMNAQKLMCKDGHVWFFGSTPVENVEAHSKTSSGVIDVATGNVVVSALLKSFEFEKALMEEHFNENYVESDKFPKAVFKGQILNNAEVAYSKDGKYTGKISGDLTLHGVTKKITTEVIMDKKTDLMHVTGKFTVTPQDFNIEIPSLVKDKIAKNIDINIDMNFK